MKNLTISKSNNLTTINDSILLDEAIEDKQDIISLTNAFFTNVMNQIPVFGVFSGTAKDYYAAKVSKKRETELKSFLKHLNSRIEGIEIKKEALDYFENSLIFHLEEITTKMISNPEKGFNEIFSAFISNALLDVETPPEEKDLVLSTLLLIDKLDLKIFKQVDIVFNKNLNQGNQKGAEVHQIEDSLTPEGITKVMVSRAIERLQSQDLIQPISNNTAQIQEGLSVADLHKGLKSKQYYPSSGYVISEYGRTLMRLANIKHFK